MSIQSRLANLERVLPTSGVAVAEPIPIEWLDRDEHGAVRGPSPDATAGQLVVWPTIEAMLAMTHG